MSSMCHKAALAGCSVVVAVLAAACASSGSSGSAGAGSSPASSAPGTGSGATSGSAIKIMALAPFNTPYDSEPYIYEGVQASAANVNRNGGVNGHPIDVVVCNDMNDPSNAAACAQQAVSEHVAAVVGASSLENTSSVFPVLAQAGIPEIAPEVLGIDELTSKDAFVLNGDVPSMNAGCAWEIAKAGARNIKTVQTDAAAAAAQVPFINEGLKPFGLTAGAAVRVPTNTVDYSPYAASALSGNTSGLILVQDVAGTEQVLTQMAQLGADFTKVEVCMPYNQLTEQGVAAIGAAANNAYVCSAYPSRTSAALAPVVAQLQARDKNILLSDATFNSWYGTQLFAKVAATIKNGPVTGRAVLQALNTSKPISLVPGEPPYDPAKAHSGPAGLNNLVNRRVYLFQIKNLQYVPFPTPYLSDAFNPPAP
jgi:branched-chain amino acid transport system substrate-binding protein